MERGMPEVGWEPLIDVRDCMKRETAPGSSREWPSEDMALLASNAASLGSCGTGGTGGSGGRGGSERGPRSYLSFNPPVLIRFISFQILLPPPSAGSERRDRGSLVNPPSCTPGDLPHIADSGSLVGLWVSSPVARLPLRGLFFLCSTCELVRPRTSSSSSRLRSNRSLTLRVSVRPELDSLDFECRGRAPSKSGNADAEINDPPPS